MSNAITIKSVQVTNLHFLKVNYDERKENGIIDTLTRKSTAPVHDDLKAAIKELDIHLALLCEEVEIPSDKKFKEIKELIKEFRETQDENLFGEKILKKCVSFHVVGVSTKGENLQESVILHGEKFLTNLKSVSLTTPSTSESEHHTYPFWQQLSEAIYILESEVILFLMEGKQAPPRQQEMDFDENEGKDNNPEAVE